jgi:hypothetical protein
MPTKYILIITRISSVGMLLLVYCTLITVPIQAQNCIVFGTYSSVPTVSHNCALNLISFNYSSWIFTDKGNGNIWVSGSPQGTVPVLKGLLNCNDSTFSVEVTLAGNCTERYLLTGSFSNDTSWSGTFKIMFSGGDCFDCNNQVYVIAGSANHPTGISTITIVAEPSLHQNYPNPFNATTSITYTIQQKSLVSLKVYNVLGSEVVELVNGQVDAGIYKIIFNGFNLNSGVYFYTIKSDAFSETKKLILMK